MSKKSDTIEIQTSSIDSCNLTDVDLKQNLIPSGILAVQELSELVYVLCTKSRSVHCKPMGMHRNEIRS